MSPRIRHRPGSRGIARGRGIDDERVSPLASVSDILRPLSRRISWPFALNPLPPDTLETCSSVPGIGGCGGSIRRVIGKDVPPGRRSSTRMFHGSWACGRRGGWENWRNPSSADPPEVGEKPRTPEPGGVGEPPPPPAMPPLSREASSPGKQPSGPPVGGGVSVPMDPEREDSPKWAEVGRHFAPRGLRFPVVLRTPLPDPQEGKMPTGLRSSARSWARSADSIPRVFQRRLPLRLTTPFPVLIESLAGSLSAPGHCIGSGGQDFSANVAQPPGLLLGGSADFRTLQRNAQLAMGSVGNTPSKDDDPNDDPYESRRNARCHIGILMKASSARGTGAGAVVRDLCSVVPNRRRPGAAPKPP